MRWLWQRRRKLWRHMAAVATVMFLTSGGVEFNAQADDLAEQAQNPPANRGELSESDQLALQVPGGTGNPGPDGAAPGPGRRPDGPGAGGPGGPGFGPGSVDRPQGRHGRGPQAQGPQARRPPGRDDRGPAGPGPGPQGPGPDAHGAHHGPGPQAHGPHHGPGPQAHGPHGPGAHAPHGQPGHHGHGPQAHGPQGHGEAQQLLSRMEHQAEALLREIRDLRAQLGGGHDGRGPDRQRAEGGRPQRPQFGPPGGGPQRGPDARPQGPSRRPQGGRPQGPPNFDRRVTLDDSEF